jgi:2Fe-2S ferredoxin
MLTVEGHGQVPVLGADVSVLELCEAAGIDIEAACGGFACCNTCRVQVLAGAENLSPLLDEERAFLDADDQRLGCQCRVLGPVSLRLAPGA